MELKRFFVFTVLVIFILFSQINAQQTNVPTTREMNLLTWTEFAEFVPEQVETVLLPTGSIEPHGVIPSGSDNLAPEAMAREIAEQLNAFIAPTLNYGVTPRMQAYPGAVSISEKSYAPFVKEVITGLAKNKFKNVIVINGHGGNTSSLNSVVHSLKIVVRLILIKCWIALAFFIN